MENDIADRIADHLITAHIEVMEENNDLRKKLDSAMLFLAILRDKKNYPIGGYSSELQSEWDDLLHSHYGKALPRRALDKRSE